MIIKKDDKNEDRVLKSLTTVSIKRNSFDDNHPHHRSQFVSFIFGQFSREPRVEGRVHSLDRPAEHQPCAEASHPSLN